MPGSPSMVATCTRPCSMVWNAVTSVRCSAARPVSGNSHASRGEGASCITGSRTGEVWDRMRSASIMVSDDGSALSSRSRTARQRSKACKAAERSPSAECSCIRRVWAVSLSRSCSTQRVVVSSAFSSSPASVCHWERRSKTVLAWRRQLSRCSNSQSSKSGVSGKERPSRKLPR